MIAPRAEPGNGYIPYGDQVIPCRSKPYRGVDEALRAIMELFETPLQTKR
jgi:hypothetical protein